MDGDAGPIRIARNVAVSAFGLSLLAGMLLPVYTDDLGWRLQERAGLDGVDKLFSDACGPGTLAVPPFFMMPVRHYSAFFNSAFPDPFWIRASGVFYALAWAGLLLAVLARALPERRRRDTATTIVFALLGLGVLPWLMIWSRPEQPLLLTLAGALLLALPPREQRQWVRGWHRPALVMVLAAIALSYHLKAAVMAPAFLACVALSVRGRKARIARAIVASLTLGVFALGAHYWFARMQCPGDPVIARQFATQNLLALLKSGKGLDSAMLLRNLSLPEYFSLASPRPVMMSEWLPSGRVSGAASTVWILLLTLAWMAAIVLAVRTALPRAIAHMRAGRVERAPVLSALLFAVVVGWGVTQVQRNTYEAMFVLPIVALAIALALGAAAWSKDQHRLLRKLALALAGLAVLSQAAVLALYGPSLVASARHPGVRAEQPLSLGVLGYGKVRRDVIAAAALCRITPGRHLKGLTIDETTYLTFVDSYRPHHWWGVLGPSRGSIADPIAFLRARQSSGLVMACRNLPPGLRARAKEHAGICCIGPPGW